MCRPTFYGIEYEINPWMDVRRQSSRFMALKQWKALRRVLAEEIGAEVVTIRAKAELPDMCFTANAGLVHDGIFIAGRFRHSERTGEETHFARWFRERDYRIVHLPESYRFEGAGDALFVGDHLFTGYYFRSDIQTHAYIGRELGVKALSLALTDRRFYHLDTCLAPIGPSAAIYYPGAFDRYSLKVLRENIDDLLPVRAEEAYHLACNVVAVGKKAVISKDCPCLAGDLEKRGFTVYPLDLSEFIKAGGAARCLTLQIG
jgi:N-dimethylarginine dimethylaminohydrolase